jgi:protease-4
LAAGGYLGHVGPPQHDEGILESSMERKARPGFIRRTLSGIWRALDRIRQASLNLIFLAVVAFLVAGWLASRPAPLPPDAALLIAPGAARRAAQRQVADEPAAGRRRVHQVLLRDVVDAIRGAATDSRIKALVIETDGLSGAGLAKLEEIAAAIDVFRQTGKKVHAWGRHFDQAQYHLAAHADEVFLNPDGYVLLTGFGRYPTYFKGLFDQAGVKMQVFRVGTYKSFVEPYTRSDMSPEDREATRLYLDAAWQAYQADIAAARPKAAAGLARYVADAPAQLAAAGGDAAAMARSAGLVDGLKTADEWRSHLVGLFGKGDEARGFKHVEMSTYVARLREEAPQRRQDRRGRGPGRHRRRRAAAGQRGRRFGGRADPPGPRGRRRQGRGAARRQPGAAPPPPRSSAASSS